MFNQTYASIVVSIDNVTGQIEHLEKRLSKFDDCSLNARQLRRKARIEKRLGFKEDRLEYLNEQLGQFSPVAPKDTEDSMQVEFWVDPITGENRGLNISITDSSSDDTYEGGTDLTFSLRGTGRFNGKGWSSFGSRQKGLLSGGIAPIDDTATTFLSAGSECLDGSYPELSLTAFDSDNNIVFSQLISV